MLNQNYCRDLKFRLRYFRYQTVLLLLDTWEYAPIKSPECNSNFCKHRFVLSGTWNKKFECLQNQAMGKWCDKYYSSRTMEPCDIFIGWTDHKGESYNLDGIGSHRLGEGGPLQCIPPVYQCQRPEGQKRGPMLYLAHKRYVKRIANQDSGDWVVSRSGQGSLGRAKFFGYT